MSTDYVALSDRLEAERDQLREQLTAARQRRISLERERDAWWERAEKAERERDELAAMLERVLDDVDEARRRSYNDVDSVRAYVASMDAARVRLARINGGGE